MPPFDERVILDPLAPSAVRVLGRSMYLIAAGWALSISWLWVEGIRQHLRRYDAVPPDYALGTIAGGVAPALLMAGVGWIIGRYAGRAPYRTLDRREWRHALWWSLLPNVLLLATVWLMLQENR
ncbi:MAG: hypothetical protein AB7Q29_13835 [Vicinamibacterales bacterium]